MRKVLSIPLLLAAATSLTACIVPGRHGPVVVAPPVVVRPAPVVVAPPAPVYVAPPVYGIPGPGYLWQYHPRYGWGWHHPHRGWHRGWR